MGAGVVAVKRAVARGFAGVTLALGSRFDRDAMESEKDIMPCAGCVAEAPSSFFLWTLMLLFHCFLRRFTTEKLDDCPRPKLPAERSDEQKRTN